MNLGHNLQAFESGDSLMGGQARTFTSSSGQDEDNEALFASRFLLWNLLQRKIEKRCRIRKVYIWILSTLCLKDVFTVPLRRMKMFFLWQRTAGGKVLGHVIV